MSFKRIAFLFFIINLPLTLKSQNLALYKSYSLSVSPNYPYTAPSSDKTSLTDGVYTKGYFWAAKTTVGWQHVPVIITIDLGEQQPIGTLTFNTVRREDQYVNFPKNIFVFISNDNDNFQYIGDAAQDSGNVQGPYLVKKLMLNNIHTVGRYVRLSVIPDGTFLFCDEIEVLKGKAKSLNIGRFISKENLPNMEDSLKNLEFLRGNIVKYLDKQGGQSNNAGVGAAKRRGIRKQLENENLSARELNDLKKQIGVTQVLNTRQRFKSSFLIQRYNPWDTLSQFFVPSEPSENLQYQYYIPVNGVQYGAFLIMNNSTVSKAFAFKINDISSFTDFSLFNVPFVPSLNYQEVPDPLIKVGNNMEIEAGNTAMILFKITGLKEGSSEITLIVTSSGKQSRININTSVFNLTKLKTNQNLNTNVWAYFNYPLINDRKEEAATDLQEHLINTMVIPPAILPMIKTTDYSRFGNYLSNIKEVKNILLFMNYASVPYKNGYPNGQFLSSEWKANFIEWYNKLTAYIKQNGFPNSNIYLYPYDEVHGKDIQDFRNFIIWVKAAIPGIKIYATLANDDAIETILPLVDIAQIQSTYKGLKNLPPHKCEIWIYSGSGPARSLSPYSFYRLMSWEAFADGYTGIGFWNYADEGVNKKLNLITDPLISPKSSYSVIYDGPGKTIISSRRWEAFRLGIEDFFILQAYSKKYGINKTRDLANQVLSRPSDVYLADSIRNQMIPSLIGLN